MSRFHAQKNSRAGIALAIGLLTCGEGVLAQDKLAAPPAPRSAEPEKKPLDEDADLLMMRCATLLDAVEIATVDKKATDPQRAAAAEAQDAIVDVLLWTNGYLNGRDGGEAMTRPLTRKWVTDNVGTLAKRCAVDEKRYVTEVIRSL